MVEYLTEKGGAAVAEASRYEEFSRLDVSGRSLLVLIDWEIVVRFQKNHNLTGIKIRSFYWSHTFIGRIKRWYIDTFKRTVKVYGGRYSFPTKTVTLYPDAILNALIFKRALSVAVEEVIEIVIQEGPRAFCFALTHEFGHASMGKPQYFKDPAKVERRADDYAEEHLNDLEGAFKIEVKVAKK